MPASRIKHRLGHSRFYLLLLAGLSLAAVTGYFVGLTVTELQQQKLQQQQQTIESLNQENHRLTRQLNIISVELEVEKQANKQTREDLRQSVEDSQQIREELSFYQKVLAPELAENGFVIDSVDIVALSEPNSYRLSIVLMQQEKRRRFVKGNLVINLEGFQGETVSLSGESLGADKLAFQFRYFEVLETTIRLPEGFEPQQLLLEARLTSQGDRGERYQQGFEWVTSSRD